jgi:hypothetical protein
MADNVNITAGTGTIIAADDIGGVLHQRVKIAQGADGVGVDVSPAAPLQVTLANHGANAVAVKVDGSAATQPVSGTVAVSTVNSVAPAFGTGVRGVTVQRVTIATDDVVPAAQSGIWTVQPGNTANTTAWKVDGSAVTQPVSIATVPSHAVTNAGTFAIQDSEKLADNAAFTDGTTKVVPTGYIYDDVAGTALTENDIGAARMDSKRSQMFTLEDATTRGQKAAVSAAGALKVDGSAVTQPVSLTGNQAVNVAQINAVAPLMGNGVTGTGSQRVTLASDNTAISTAGFMSVKIDQTTVGTTNAVTQIPAATGGLTTYHLVSAATTNATNIKASAGQVFGWYIYNSNAAARKVVFHNSAAAPTAGASVFFAIVIPPSSGANVEFGNGIAFSAGIGITTVTDLTDAGATAVAANDLIINIFYK